MMLMMQKRGNKRGGGQRGAECVRKGGGYENRGAGGAGGILVSILKNERNSVCV